MLDNIKYLICFKSIDKNIADNKFDKALEKLNFLINVGFRPAETYLKRGQLCKKLLMMDDAYSDFTYIIRNCAYKKEAYYERLLLNFEIANYYEALLDANIILEWDIQNKDVKRIKFLSLLYSRQEELAREYILNMYDYHIYRTIQFLFNEVATVLANDEYAKGLKLLDLIELIDKDNPVKLLKEATIYGLAGENGKQDEILNKIEEEFPKYFKSHFKYTDMYQERDLLETCFLLELSVFDKQGVFEYEMKLLEAYKNHIEGHIIDSKDCLEEAIAINPDRADAYVLIAQTFQLMSGYDNPEYQYDAQYYYQQALEIFLRENLTDKAEDMKRQIKHLNSSLSLR